MGVLASTPGPARDRGVRDLYLREVGRQSRYALAALAIALSVPDAELDGDDSEVWPALQSALVAAALVSRILDGSRVHGGQAARRHAKKRGAELRALLEVEEDSPLLERRLRDHLEHLDERLDRLALDEQRTVYVDLCIVRGQRVMAVAADQQLEEISLREFGSHSGFAAFGGEAFDLFALRFELNRVRERVALLLQEPVPHADLLTKVSVRFVSAHRVNERGQVMHGDPYESGESVWLRQQLPTPGASGKA